MSSGALPAWDQSGGGAQSGRSQSEGGRPGGVMLDCGPGCACLDAAARGRGRDWTPFHQTHFSTSTNSGDSWQWDFGRTLSARAARQGGAGPELWLPHGRGRRDAATARSPSSMPTRSSRLFRRAPRTRAATPLTTGGGSKLIRSTGCSTTHSRKLRAGVWSDRPGRERSPYSADSRPCGRGSRARPARLPTCFLARATPPSPRRGIRGHISRRGSFRPDRTPQAVRRAPVSFVIHRHGRASTLDPTQSRAARMTDSKARRF